MNKTNKLKLKTVIITDIIMALLIVTVVVVGLAPNKSVAILGESGYYAIYNGDKSSKNVSLMFNVYENTEVVNGILDLLEKENVSATFFVGGCWADDNIKTLKRIINDGHELANHGYFHKDHSKIGAQQNRLEIENCHKIVYSLTGSDMNLFAPPSGAFNKTTLQVAESLNYKTIMWSKDTIDWRDSNKSLLVSRATKNLSGGDLILMHPKQHTLNALTDIITIIKNKGFNIVSVSKCCNFTT